MAILEKEVKANLKARSKEIRQKIQQKYTSAEIRHCYPDFCRGVYQVRFSLSGETINKTFDLDFTPDFIVDSIEERGKQ